MSIYLGLKLENNKTKYKNYCCSYVAVNEQRKRGQRMNEISIALYPALKVIKHNNCGDNL